MEFFRTYKVLMYQQENNMTLIDLQSFIKTLEFKIKEEQKNHKNDDKMIKSLYAIGDIINYMRYKDGKPK